MRRRLEVDQIAVIILNESLRRGFDRTLIAAEFAFHGTRNINAAQLLEIVIGDAVLEYVAPRIGKRPENRGHMGANSLAFRPRRTFARATVELGEHGLIRYRRGVHITDVRLAHRGFS